MSSAAPILHAVIMGVSGGGKTTLARQLGEQLHWPVLEADDLHPAENLAELQTGTIPSKESSLKWLETVRDWMTSRAEENHSTVVACPSLTRKHRDILRQAHGIVFFIHLYGTRDVLARRMAQRVGPPMPPELLEEQLNLLQRLTTSERGLQLDIMRTPEQLVEDSLSAIAFAQRAYEPSAPS
ncbi:gluconokinase [Corynebacterium heidelbergense]|uniref:Gluconokinase n=1 Tax=Corynebacterium heidelbergense TaxID=2055947 RepID=A0A364V887_9CORY|nr:gluconokinase, GntK/IdnK-type [Corynebacterium heidelbergense]RAV32776.1 gluconokinase [Corynebacterium heidelbergense]